MNSLAHEVKNNSSPLRTGMMLGLCVLIAIGALAITNELTRQRIENARREWLMQSLTTILPPGPYDNDPLASQQLINAPELGSKKALPVYTVYRQGKPLASVLSVVAPDGYNGDIRLLVGISFAGQIVGVRVSEHRETPGLGDDIDYPRSKWITQFDNLSLQTTPSQVWDVRKNGGRFDAFTGATITPRAVIKAVQRALLWHELHRQELYSS